MKKLVVCAIFTMLAGCASTVPTKIGADTFYAVQTNTAGIRGDVSAVARSLLLEGAQYCAAIGKEFELVHRSTTPPAAGVRFWGAFIAFRCLDQADNLVILMDKRGSTIAFQ